MKGELMKVLTIANQKGGVGKTATASALIGYLKQKGKSVLAIDLDAQRNLTACVGASDGVGSMIDVFIKAKSLEDVIQHTDQCDIIASNKELASAEGVLTTKGNIKQFTMLKDIIESNKTLLSGYDYILLDTPPTINAIFTNVLIACNVVLIPLEADASSLTALYDLCDNINEIKDSLNKSIKIGGVFLTRYNERTILSQALLNETQGACKELGIKYIDASIRESIAIKEAKLLHQNIFDYEPNSKVCNDYKKLFDTLAKNKAL